MKKLIAICLLLTLVVGPNLALAANIGTGLTQDTTGGANPVVKAKWEANIDRYTDDDLTAGAQFMPSGQNGVNKTISMCAIVTDPDGLEDVINAYADVFYPAGVELGGSHVPLDDQSGDGCGQLMQEDSLTKLSKADGFDLFCNKVKNLNNNLPTFASNYNYNEICNPDGELQKETAAVFCGTKDLSYEDPSGEYKVWAIGQDKVGLQGSLENHFTYLPSTVFEVDFTSINYGNVRLNTHKIINGNLAWDTPAGENKASVRNVGNTRLAMSVWQNDMGFGKTSGNWNVRYDARVSSSAAFAQYYPEVTTLLADQLDLSEKDEMDFSIDVSKFPPTHTGPYTGTMTLSASPVSHLTNCPPTVGADLDAYVAPIVCDVTVDDDGGNPALDTIQEGINAAIPGQIVCVKAGTYTQDVNVNKSITLVGDGPNLTSLTGVGTGWGGALTVATGIDNVTIEGFTINGTGQSAVYLISDNNNIDVFYNRIVAATNKNALLTGGQQTNSALSNNVFEGNGSQLVYVNGSASLGVANASSNVDFTSNTFGGTATGPLLGIEANSSSVAMNKFSGTTGYTSIESWEGNNLVNQNNFNVVGQMDINNSVNPNTQNVGTLNAENNWWGDITPADNITGLVDFTPFEVAAFPQN